MNINVLVLCDRCIKCPRLEIETHEMWANNEIYEKEFVCKHLYGCQIAVDVWEKQNESNISD